MISPMLSSRLHAGYMAPFYEAIQRGMESGQLCDGKPAEIVAALVGPVFYRRWFSREPLDEPFVKSVVNNIEGMAKQ